MNNKEIENGFKGAVSGSVLINKSTKLNSFIISSKHEIFKNESIIIKIYDTYFEIKVPSICWEGKVTKTVKNNKSKDWRFINIINEKLIIGNFLIDIEESDEDRVVVHYR
jgi:hypothetical protein